MDMVAWVQILDETLHISQSANILGESMNAIILPPATCKCNIMAEG